MSEYQYYEFQPIDRTLTKRETAFLRRYSSRATITATRFVNHYDWGDFKGDEDAWMDRFFDAFFYTANWGTSVLKLRVPSARLSLPTARAYCAGEAISARQRGGNTIITLTSTSDGGDWDGEHSTLSSFVTIRAGLVRGDLRALYLGWLSAAQHDDIDEDAVEPPVPPGLGQFDGCLEELVELLRIDEGLLRAAARASASLAPAPTQRALSAWLKEVGVKEKDAVLARILADEPHAAMDLRDRFFAAHRARHRVHEPRRRSVGALLTEAS